MAIERAVRWVDRGWPRQVASVAGLALGLGAAACGGGTSRTESGFAPVQRAVHGSPAGTLGVQVRWTLDLGPKFGGRYIPVERAGLASDDSGNLFAGSSYGVLWSLDPSGREIWRRDIGAGVESAPVTDTHSDLVWVAGINGALHALAKADGSSRWTTQIGGAVSAAPTLTDDAVYLVTDDDKVVAVSRTSGEILWRFAHDAAESNLAIAGHAGLLIRDGRLYTGFSDGSVVALDASDGRRLWQVDTSLDLESSAGEGTSFVDVDTTPVKIGSRLFVASFAAGLYVLAADTGVLLSRHAEFTGVTSMAGEEDTLVLSSAEQGIVCVDVVSMTPRWTRRPKAVRGAPTEPQIHENQLFVGESRGALLVLSLADGQELARLESGHGYTASPLLGERGGVVLSNAARLLAFQY